MIKPWLEFLDGKRKGEWGEFECYVSLYIAEWYEQIVDKEKERHYTGLGDLQSATSISLGAEENKNKNEKKSSRHGVFLVGHPTKS